LITKKDSVILTRNLIFLLDKFWSFSKRFLKNYKTHFPYVQFMLLCFSGEKEYLIHSILNFFVCKLKKGFPNFLSHNQISFSENFLFRVKSKTFGGITMAFFLLILKRDLFSLPVFISWNSSSFLFYIMDKSQCFLFLRHPWLHRNLW